MAIGLKAGAIAKYFGGKMMVKEIDPDGTDLASPDTFKAISYVGEEGEIDDNIPIEEIIDETGETVAITEDARKVVLKGNFLQSDKDLIDFLTSTCRNKYYAVYRYLGVINGYHQEAFFGICRFKPGLNLKTGVKRPAYEVYVLKNDTAITIAALGLPTGAKTAAEVVIPAGAYYKIVETAVS